MLRSGILFIFLKLAVAVRYDSFTGEEATDELIEYYTNNNILENCTNDVQLPCDPTERRRLDGTCLNAKYPSRGAFHTPVVKILSDEQCEDVDIHTAVSGTKLKTSRQIRTHVLQTGKGSDPEYTQMLPNAMAITFNDLGSIHDSFNFLLDTPTCCTEAGKDIEMCAPMTVSADDPVHRFSGVTCLNLTQPKTFQTSGCVQDKCSDRMEFTTALFDLSSIYRSTEPAPEYRAYTGGLLLTQEADGITFPPHEGPHSKKCLQNGNPSTDKCFGPVSTSIPPVTLFSIWEWRLHNKIATQLSELNPKWGDDKLFEIARDINIAITVHLIYYQLLPTVFGKDFCLEKGLITTESGFRDPYDESEIPKLFNEYFYSMRWFHLVQEGTFTLYDEEFNPLSQEEAAKHTLRCDFLMKDQNLAKMTRGAYYDPAADRDSAVDPNICDFGLGAIQRATDLTAADLEKGRHFRLKPYADYVKYCHNIEINCWEDFLQLMTVERMEVLQDVYYEPGDVELLPGLWVETPMKNGYVPATLACILEKQFTHSMKADPHWYQRENRPHAFTLAQLQEIEKATFAGYLCEVADGVTKIQPDVFRRVSETNQFVTCDDIPRWNLTAWKD